MNFSATLHPVLNRGTPPASFLRELVAWGKDAPDEIFAPNANPADIYALTRETLGPWGLDLALRRAGMLEIMRVHAGFESSWNWNEGVDKTNRTSMTHRDGEESGAFQVSFDSSRIAHSAMLPFLITEEINSAPDFIHEMKQDHDLAMEYYARLVRVSITWAGPLAKGAILPWLRREAVAEFQCLLK